MESRAGRKEAHGLCRRAAKTGEREERHPVPGPAHHGQVRGRPWGCRRMRAAGLGGRPLNRLAWGHGACGGRSAGADLISGCACRMSRTPAASPRAGRPSRRPDARGALLHSGGHVSDAAASRVDCSPCPSPSVSGAERHVALCLRRFLIQ